MTMTVVVNSSMVFLVVAFLFNAVASHSTGYTNHTVGGTAGWFYNIATQKASSDYSAWAAKQTFNLGDYLSITFRDPEILMTSKLKNANHICFCAATSRRPSHVIDFSV
ncbi:hypothetical protein RND71_001188 [Anisodus tanguticus]|uniref:Phytocyanin domain-containing protein n=1 Tax=Anisodus tanguticus TaxID=243964 RepID=A0AAE1T2E5_9SOLA|nr:hypothetical protein RND71_001188 [Anisodus tanguticus]